MKITEINLKFITKLISYKMIFNKCSIHYLIKKMKTLRLKFLNVPLKIVNLIKEKGKVALINKTK